MSTGTSPSCDRRSSKATQPQWTDADTHYEGPGDPELADACIQSLQAAGLPALGITFGATAAGSSTMPLDWGALIPFWFMRAPAVVVSPCRARLERRARAGRGGPGGRDGGIDGSP